MNEPDIVIIGAGAAGVGAGLELRERGIAHIIVEAANRVGGRALTATGGLERAWDHGCHWLHCATENPLVPWADRLGIRYDNETREAFLALWNGGFADRAEIARSSALIDQAFGALHDAGKAGQDVPVSEVMPDAGDWTPALRMIFQLLSSEDPERVSAAAYTDYDDVQADWPVRSGYGTLIAAMAKGLPVRLGTPAQSVVQDGPGVRVETPRGTISARAAIVTVSSNVLSSGNIRFGAGPAADLVDAMADIPCGACEKVAFTLTDMPAEFRGRLFSTVQAGHAMGAIHFQIIEEGGPMLVHHIAGTPAREMSRAGPEAMTALATEHLVTAFGGDITRLITGTATTNWTRDPLVRGAYSYARPGMAQARRDLIGADTGLIGFAGEAFSPGWQATAHGAYQSGRDVAARLADRVADRVAGADD